MVNISYKRFQLQNKNKKEVLVQIVDRKREYWPCPNGMGQVLIIIIFRTNRAIVCGTRAYCREDFREDVARRNINKMASKITSVSEANIRFLSSVSIPNLRQGLLEHFFESSYDSEDDSSDSDVCSSINISKYLAALACYNMAGPISISTINSVSDNCLQHSFHFNFLSNRKKDKIAESFLSKDIR